MGYQVLTDEYINKLFEGTNFGEHVNQSVNEKRKQIEKTLKDQINGYWSGSTAYGIVIRGGFLNDAKFGKEKKLTPLGIAFLQEQAA